MAASYSSSPRYGNEYDFDDNDSFDFDDERDFLDQPSDEDTEDASETDMAKQEEQFTEIKEQMYQQKLAQLKKQLQQLQDGTLPEYMKKSKKIEQQYKDRLRVNDIWYQYEMEMVEKEYVKEKKAAVKEFEERKIELKESLILELEDKKKSVEYDRVTVELSGAFTDNLDVKPVTTRKLRRRPNDPTPVPEKRRKPSPDILSQINFCLDDDEVMEDLKIINKVSGKPLNRKPTSAPSLIPSGTNPNIIYDSRIDDGRLYFDKKWFHRSQPVFVESKDAGKVSAIITAIGTQEVWLRRTSDNGKLRVYVTQLQKGKYLIRKRPT